MILLESDIFVLVLIYLCDINTLHSVHLSFSLLEDKLYNTHEFKKNIEICTLFFTNFKIKKIKKKSVIMIISFTLSQYRLDGEECNKCCTISTNLPKH